MDPAFTQTLDLVRQAQGGDGDAYNRLMERYYERVRRIVRLRLGSRLRQRLDSGDILQETFAAAVKSFERFEMRDEASLIHWLSKLAERQILAAADYHGAARRDPGQEVPLHRPAPTPSAYVAVDLPDTDPEPVDGLAHAEQGEVVEACIRALPEELRELIVLRNYAGASWESVAHETGRPSADAARMLHARALVELGKLVRSRGVDG
jgi:RNA polymerase sigma-70 factor (ECF subfamily)